MLMLINTEKDEEMEGSLIIIKTEFCLYPKTPRPCSKNVKIFPAEDQANHLLPCRAATEQTEFGGIRTFHAHLLMKLIPVCLYQHKSTERD